ncbi:MAG: hypothetical protein ACI4KR_04675 [Ruminiclostridium sp.]
MASNNNKEAVKKTNSAEVAEKDLEAVSGGSIGIDIDPQTLRKLNKDAEILVKLENTSAQENPQKSEESNTDMSVFSIVR